MSAPTRTPARPPQPRARARWRRSRGVALMEALIGVLLLSMAALAYAALQVRGLTGNASAMWRSKATLLATEMADRLRANPTGVAEGRYAALSSAEAPACGEASACTPANMARLDHVQWSAALANDLPQGRGVVCLDATPDDGQVDSPACDGAGAVFAVKVFWRERGEASRLTVAVRP
ncbi:type IV pilus modification protein PilV [Aquabacterium sp. OR-4]|uniref:type IV pilus modification protein PilV n=1 Tax=Aquabacterium sp. OR-4 TaxID=2978127 RepID=UPI0021B382EE|nr:type IV pilus modification protein PilV [Aquabacterium sp. OR-4]MDT7834243.1 type IV pilus modification protein PilV [Aquabacterium sp. OR-4]